MLVVVLVAEIVLPKHVFGWLLMVMMLLPTGTVVACRKAAQLGWW